MKKILAVLVLAAGALHAQVSNPSIIQPPSSPAGNSCTNQLPLQVYQGVLYSCQSGVVTALGGSGTVTSVSVTPANGVSGTVATATTTPAITLILGAITPTSLLATGIVDGQAPITITTGTTANLGATYNSGYTFNQEATAGTGVTYTLPATATGKQYCVANSGTTGVVNTGVLTVYPPSSSYIIYKGVVNTVGGGGTHGIASGGAAGDSACFIAIDSTHWLVLSGSGVWTEN